jgi:hypothetical protein
VGNEEVCQMLQPILACCGQYGNYTSGSACLITKLRDPDTRSRILELAEGNQILVPTCDGAYVPAAIALRDRSKRKDGSL